MRILSWFFSSQKSKDQLKGAHIDRLEDDDQGLQPGLDFRRGGVGHRQISLAIKRELATVTPGTPNWKEWFTEACDSPAEVAFLEAAVQDMDLLPHRGALKSDMFSLTMQSDFKFYRVDFILNGSLMIEIDGATYHSSPEAQKSDEARDAYFETIGYTTLRVPAKDVFRTPLEVMKRVRAALPAAEGAKRRKRAADEAAAAETSKPAGFFQSIQNANDLLTSSLARVHREVAEQEERSKRLHPEVVVRIRTQKTVELLGVCDPEFIGELAKRVDARREADLCAGLRELGDLKTPGPSDFGIPYDEYERLRSRGARAQALEEQYVSEESVHLFNELRAIRPRWRAVEEMFDETTSPERYSELQKLTSTWWRLGF